MGALVPRVVTSTSASGAQVIDGSLRFDEITESRMTRTMFAGDERRFTISCWVKRTFQYDYLYLMGVSAELSFYFTNTGKLHAEMYSPDGTTWAVISDTQGTFRDTSWYHVVATLDSSAGTTNADRFKIYVNGVQQTIDFTTYWAHLITGNVKHLNENGQTFQMNSRPGAPYYNSFYLSQYNYLDGSVLGPENFGYTDPLTNTWRPKKAEFPKRTFTNPKWYSSATLYEDVDDVVLNATDRGNGGVTITDEYAYLVMNDGGYATNGGGANSPDYPVWTDTPSFTDGITRVFYYYSGEIDNWYNAASYGSTAAEWNQWRYTNSTAYAPYRVGRNFDIEGGAMLVFCANATSDNPTNAGKLASFTLPTFDTGSFNFQNSVIDTWYRGGNSFYLPFDGNSAIGKDKSGNGNDFTPLDFGGSNAIDKATGALPILNTLSDSIVSVSGVRKEVIDLPEIIKDSGCVSFNGTGDWLGIGWSSDFEFGQGDFTIEFYVNYSGNATTSTRSTILSWGADSNNRFDIGCEFDSSLPASEQRTINMFGKSSGTTIIDGYGVISTSKWTHVAVVGYSDIDGNGTTGVALYVDGVRKFVNTGALDTYPMPVDGGMSIDIGRKRYGNTISDEFIGFISNLRIVKGSAIYPYSGSGAGFTPPTEPLTNVTNTKLLCCQSPTQTVSAAVSPNISGINDGTVWSSYIEGPFYNVGYSKEKMFNGSTTGAYLATDTDPEDVTINFPGGLAFSSKLRIMGQATQSGGQITFHWDGGSYIWSIDHTQGAYWEDLSSNVTSPITSITWTTMSTGTYGPYVNALEVDDVILTDPLILHDNGSGGKIWEVYATTDELAGSCVLALPMVGIRSDVSNLINSGSNEKVISYNGLPGSKTIQTSFYGVSYYFDGNDDYLAVYDSSTDDLKFGTADYTIEFWVRPTAVAYYWMFSKRNNYSGVAPYNMMTTSSGQFEYGSSSDDASWDIVNQVSFGSYKAKEWTHVAVVKNGGVITGYCNGVGTVLATGVTLGPFEHNPEEPLHIGDLPVGGTYDLNGYMNDFRIYKGVAKYTKDFIPASTNPDILPDNPSGVALGSQLAKVPVVDGGSVSFPVNAAQNHYVEVPDSADFTFGTGDFTIEAFFYCSQPEGTTAHSSIVQKYTTAVANNLNSSWWLGFYNSANTYDNYILFNFYHGSTSISLDSSAAGDVASNSWNHVAAVRDGTNLRLYVNGRCCSTAFVDVNQMNDSTTPVRIGIDSDGLYDMNGFISNVRIVKGTCLYPNGTTFIPSSEPLTTTSQGATASEVKLLCCQSQTQPGAAVTSPNMGGINDGTVWSDLVSGPLDSAYGNANKGWIFRGATGTVYSDGLVSYPGRYLRMDFGTQFSSATSVKLYGWASLNGDPSNGGTTGANENLKINGTVIGPGEWTSGGWYHHTFNVSGLTSLEWGYNCGSASIGHLYLGGIEVDGTLLVDPVSPMGYVAGNSFNPFTNNINVVRGQESSYCTWNPNDKVAGSVLGEGNLKIVSIPAGGGFVRGTMGMTSGKWYCEYVMGEDFYDGMIGLADRDADNTMYLGQNTGGNGYGYYVSGSFYDGTTSHAYGSTYTRESIIGVAFDADNGLLYFSNNGIWQNRATEAEIISGNAGAGTTTNAAPTGTLTRGPYFFASGVDGALNSFINFGQKPFKFPPPEGFQPLNFANLSSPEVVIPDEYVSATRWTSDGGVSALTIDTGFEPDMIWVKNSKDTQNPSVFTSILPNSATDAGRLDTSGSSAAQTGWQAYFTGFNHNGFSVSSNASDVNPAIGAYGDGNMITYAWRAGGSKNTFNVDDVGYANASDVNMDVGSLNGVTDKFYNQDQKWSVAATATAFNNDFDSAGVYVGSTYADLTDKPFSVSSTISIWIHDPGVNNPVYIKYNDVEYFNTNPTLYGWTDFKVPSSTNSGTLQVKLGFSNDNCRGVKVDGRILVDNDVNIPADYNQDQLWTTGWSQQSAGTYLSGSGITNMTPDLMFNGDLASIGCIPGDSNGAYVAGSSVTFTPNGATGIPCSTLVIKAIRGGTITVLEINGTDCSSQVDGNWQEHTITMPAGETHLKTFKIYTDNANEYIQVGYIKVDGRRIIDNDVTTLPKYPSIAATGASVGTRAGFSIVKYTGTGTAGTIPHGLNNTPTYMWVKNLDQDDDWWVYHASVGPGKYIRLNKQGDGTYPATVIDSAAWNNTLPTSSVFSVGTADNVNASGEKYIAYIWADTPGIFKAGTYDGNQLADGPFVYTEFAPAIVLSITNQTDLWRVKDWKRDGYNDFHQTLWPSNTSAQYGDGAGEAQYILFDFLSNGFKPRSSNIEAMNGANYPVHFAAWAHQPMNNLYGAQSNAR